jgi:hypothetical protein
MLRFPGLPNSQLITLIIHFTMNESILLKPCFTSGSGWDPDPATVPDPGGF